MLFRCTVTKRYWTFWIYIKAKHLLTGLSEISTRTKSLGMKKFREFFCLSSWYPVEAFCGFSWFFLIGDIFILAFVTMVVGTLFSHFLPRRWKFVVQFSLICFLISHSSTLIKKGLLIKKDLKLSEEVKEGDLSRRVILDWIGINILALKFLSR